MWEIVIDEVTNRVRRCAVTGGHLYQVERFDVEESPARGSEQVFHVGWSAPVFVPSPAGSERIRERGLCMPTKE
jgi:hypothetical protein